MRFALQISGVQAYNIELRSDRGIWLQTSNVTAPKTVTYYNTDGTSSALRLHWPEQFE